MSIELNQNVRHNGDGREGQVIGRMVVSRVDQDDEVNLLVKYMDTADRAAQAWFAEADCSAIAE